MIWSIAAKPIGCSEEDRDSVTSSERIGGLKSRGGSQVRSAKALSPALLIAVQPEGIADAKAPRLQGPQAKR